jgi:AbrB family looped-hinge helix DNA binding protein
MARKDTATRLVRLQAKGQLTLPAQFRRRLNVDEDTILRITLRGDGITITPLRPEQADSPLREFSQADITRFLREDRLDRATAAKVQRLLGRTKAA